MAPTGELITGVADSKFLALRPDSDVREALMANLGPGESLQATDLPRVPTPAGGAKVWSWTDSGNNEQSAKSIDGLLVAVLARGTLWGSEDPQSGVQPVLVSYDLMHAVRMNEDIGDLDADVLESCRIGDRLYDWRRLPYNQYGSASNGRAKRCKESRLLAILRENEAWPLLVAAGVGSFKTVLPFVKRLAVPHYRALVSLTLQKVENSGGQPYSQIVPKYLGAVGKEEGEIVRRLYTEPLSRLAEQIDVPQDAA
jgi:hypothetical protein